MNQICDGILPYRIPLLCFIRRFVFFTSISLLFNLLQKNFLFFRRFFVLLFYYVIICFMREMRRRRKMLSLKSDHSIENFLQNHNKHWIDFLEEQHPFWIRNLFRIYEWNVKTNGRVEQSKKKSKSKYQTLLRFDSYSLATVFNACCMIQKQFDTMFFFCSLLFQTIYD